jgi:hypothetical protein
MDKLDPAGWQFKRAANSHFCFWRIIICFYAFGLAFLNSVLNMRFSVLQACSDKETFGLDFISHPEGFNAAARNF